MWTVVLLILSNTFMTMAWYGHLKYPKAPLFATILISWLIALPEYALQVPANRLGQESSGFSPTSMRKPLSSKTKEQDDHGTSQTSIRHHPRLRSAMRQHAVAPIHTSGVALRHVGPRDAT